MPFASSFKQAFDRSDNLLRKDVRNLTVCPVASPMLCVKISTILSTLLVLFFRDNFAFRNFNSPTLPGPPVSKHIMITEL